MARRVVRTTPTLLNVPTPLDVDGSTGYDMCGIITVGGNGIIQQQMSKMPLAKPDLPVDAAGALLGLINFGYKTADSTIPVTFDSRMGLTGGFNVVNTYSVSTAGRISRCRPASPFRTGIPTLTNDAKPPKLTQFIGIGTALNINFRYENEPNATTVKTNSDFSDIAYTGSRAATSSILV